MSATATYLTVAEAQRIVLDHVRPGPTHDVPLAKALGHTLAEAIRTDIDYPPFDRSIMDGFAVRAGDVAAAPVTLRLVGEIAAGACAPRALSAGEAMRISTGAPVPAGADAVVRLEDADCTNGRVSVLTAARTGQHIGRSAEYAKRGQVVLEAGLRIGPGQIGVAGSAGAHEVTVYDPPRVAVLSTGDELVDIDQVPAGPQIRNSNSHVLVALVLQAGGSVVNLGNVRDERAAIEEKVREGLESDVLCITGGVSMGQFDLVPGVLEACGVHILVRKLKAKPAKPTVFGVSPHGTLVFGLPGNPISAYVGFWLLVRPALAALQGRPGEAPQPVRARLRGSLKAAGDRQSYQPATVTVEHGELIAAPTTWGGSGDPFGMARANALIVSEMDAPAVADGAAVCVLLLEAT